MNDKAGRRALRFLDDISMHTKLLCIYFLLVAVPLVLFTAFTFVRMSRVVQDQTFAAAQKIFEDTYSNLHGTLARAEQTIDILAHDQLVYHMTSNDPKDYPLISQLEDTHQLETTFSHLQHISGIDRIVLYTGSDYLYSQQNRDIFSMEDAAGTAWMQALLQQGRSSRWFTPAELGEAAPAFSDMRVLYSPVELDHPQAILRVDMSLQRIAALLEGEPVTENGVLLFLHGGSVLLSSGGAQQTSGDLAQPLSSTAPNQWNQVSVNGVACYLNHRPLAVEGWELATLIPREDIISVSRALTRDMLVMVAVLMAAAYALAYLMSRSTLRRLSALSDAMRTVEAGDTSVTITPQGKDEIGRLAHSFGTMMGRINTLMDEKESYGREIKNLELKALQAQINPHFLYNSLDLINCTALQRHVPEISKMVTALARFYKLSLSRGCEVIPLADELRHARLYLDIQNMRFENRVRVVWQVEESVLKCRAIKIILQPLIENALIHGIFERADKSGTLKLHAFRQSGDVIITVEDNGVGMDQAVLRENFTYQPQALGLAKGGYGVRNVNERLHLAYGEPYGLYCESEPGRGTRVTVRLPAAGPEHEGES